MVPFRNMRPISRARGCVKLNRLEPEYFSSKWPQVGRRECGALGYSSTMRSGTMPAKAGATGLIPSDLCNRKDGNTDR